MDTQKIGRTRRAKLARQPKHWYAECDACDGTGHSDGASYASSPACRVCNGSGRAMSDDAIHSELREQAIDNTGYRSGGAEMADEAAGKLRNSELPYAVHAEYARLCHWYGIDPR